LVKSSGSMGPELQHKQAKLYRFTIPSLVF